MLRPTPVVAQSHNTIYACVNRDGDVRIVDFRESCRHHETRVRWNVVGPQGPAGETGPQGAAGPKGPAGPQGAAGLQGPAGAAGQPGAVGPQGPKGDPGVQGLQGAAGPQGVKGDTGAQGAAGPQGAQGIQGLLGATGPQGSQGSAGPQGEKGETGASGAQGTTGPRGPQGDGFHYRGEFDPNGTYASWDVVVFGGSSYLATAQTNGAPGSDPSWTLLVSKGDTGAPGATGGQGPQGPQGVQGVKGDTGATGGQGPQGPAGANGGSVTVAAGAPAITCSGGGVTVTDALQNTQYVCDGRQGPQGPQGAQGPTGSTTLIAQTVINPTAFNFPLSNCCNTDWVVDVPGAPPGTPPVTLPNSIFKNVLTSGGALLIQATFPIWSNSGAIVFCQPNIDNHWAGATLGSASADYIFNFGSTTKVTATISRVYQVPAGVHTFSLGCAANLIGVSLPQGGVLSYSVFELH